MDIVEAHLTVQERIQLAISRLPALTKEQIPRDDACPICLNPFDAILEGKVREELNPVHTSDDWGVTKLVGCGHIFCKACLVEWIRGRHGNCPSCRRIFLNVNPPSDSDDESSDGDYVPGDDEDEDEDDAFFDSDGFMETQSMLDDMDTEDAISIGVDTDVDDGINVDSWEEEAGITRMVDENRGLSDGASDSLSEVALPMSQELLDNDDTVVYSDRGSCTA